MAAIADVNGTWGFGRTPGASLDDVRDLLTPSKWLNNFNLQLVLEAACPNLLFSMWDRVPAIPLDAFDITYILPPSISASVAVAGVASYAEHVMKKFPRFVKAIRSADVLLMPLHTMEKKHWVALRWVRMYNTMEIFLFMNNSLERECAFKDVSAIADLLAALQVLERKQMTLRIHESPAWRQPASDTSSCGLLTLATLISLVQDRRIALQDLCSNALLWRQWFAGMIMEK